LVLPFSWVFSSYHNTVTIPHMVVCVVFRAAAS